MWTAGLGAKFLFPDPSVKQGTQMHIFIVTQEPRSETKVMVTHQPITTVEVVDILTLATALKSVARLLICTFIFLKVLFFTGKISLE